MVWILAENRPRDEILEKTYFDGILENKPVNRRDR